jgi:hypothetical protein
MFATVDEAGISAVMPMRALAKLESYRKVRIDAHCRVPQPQEAS